MGLWHGAGFPVGAELPTFVPGLPLRRNRLDPGGRSDAPVAGQPFRETFVKIARTRHGSRAVPASGAILSTRPPGNMEDHMLDNTRPIRPVDSLADTVSHPTGRNSDPLISVRSLNLWYDSETHALKDVTFDLYPGEVLAFIGPSGCGKSTMLKALNRMHDMTPGVRHTGTITLDGGDIHAAEVDPPLLRRRFGWVAQKPNPFPSSIWTNVSYGPRIHGLMRDRAELEAHVEACLRKAQLWDEVKDRLHTDSGLDLSGGQQQRLCIARALSTQPDVLLMDEPTGSIDPIATAKVEELVGTLKGDKAIVIVTHSMMQARRVADRVAYFHLGRLLEIGPTETMFTAPQTPEAKAFIEGKFG
jgi:phosphate transport system ATP-binding protein